MDVVEELRIGDLGTRTGVTVETLRYYERRNLLRPTRRLASGYRVYEAGAIALVQFIKRAQTLGFTLSEVDELVRLREQAWAGDATYLLREAIVTKVRDVERRMRELSVLGDELKALVAACDEACHAPLESPCPDPSGERESAARTAVSGPDCPLVDALDAPAQAGRKRNVSPMKNARRRRDGKRATNNTR
jgi:DNA-binding transcriptional MerR regulator